MLMEFHCVTLFILSSVLIISANNYSKLPCKKWQSFELRNYLTEKDKNSQLKYYVSGNGVDFLFNETYYDENKKLMGCPCYRHPCIRKCCPYREIYKLDENSNAVCQNDSNHINLFYRLEFYNYTEGKSPEKIFFNMTTKYSIVNHEIQYECKNREMTVLNDNEFHLLTNGSILLKCDPKNKSQVCVNNNNSSYAIISIDNYCVELINDKIEFVVCKDLFLHQEVSPSPSPSPSLSVLLKPSSFIYYIIIVLSSW